MKRLILLLFLINLNLFSQNFVGDVKVGGSLKEKYSSIASASTLSLPAGNTFYVTGTTSITTMNTCDANNMGRKVSLIFADVLTFTHGNNINLSGGDFTTATGYSISLLCSGTAWYEISRSGGIVLTVSGTGTGIITLGEGTAPGAPSTSGDHNLYFDSSDSKLKSHENGGSVVEYATTATPVVKAQSPLTTKGDLWVTDGTSMNRLAVGATDGHVLTVDAASTNGVKWAAAAGGSSASIDLATFKIEDEFVARSRTTGDLFQPWASGSGAGVGQHSAWPNFGVTQMTTGATDASTYGLYLCDSPTPSCSAFGALASNAGWDLKWRFRLNHSTNVKLYLGVTASNSGGSIAPANWFGLRFDTSTSDTAFTFASASASTVTATASSVSVDTNWHTLRVRSTSAGTLLMSLDGGAETTINTNVPSSNMTAFIQISNLAAETKTVDVDYFGFLATGLSR